MLCHDHFQKSFHRHTYWDRIDKYASFPTSEKNCATTTSFFFIRQTLINLLANTSYYKLQLLVSSWKNISMPVTFTLWGKNVLKPVIYMVKLTHYLNTFPSLPSSEQKSRYASCYQSGPKQSPLEPLSLWIVTCVLQSFRTLPAVTAKSVIYSIYTTCSSTLQNSSEGPSHFINGTFSDITQQ